MYNDISSIGQYELALKDKLTPKEDHPAILVNTFCIASAKVVFIFYNPNIREEKLFLVFVKIGFCAVILYTFA